MSVKNPFLNPKFTGVALVIGFHWPQLFKPLLVNLGYEQLTIFQSTDKEEDGQGHDDYAKESSYPHN